MPDCLLILAQSAEFHAASEPSVVSAWSIGRIAAYVVSIGVIGLGVRVLWFGKSRSHGTADEASVSVRGLGWFARLTPPTQIVIGLGLVLVAYHVAAWVSPPEWFALQIPREQWWVLCVLVGLGVGGSLVAERLERQ